MSAPRVKWSATVELSGAYAKETGWGDTPQDALTDLEARIDSRISGLRKQAADAAGNLRELVEARSELILDSVPS